MPIELDYPTDPANRERPLRRWLRTAARPVSAVGWLLVGLLAAAGLAFMWGAGTVVESVVRSMTRPAGFFFRPRPETQFILVAALFVVPILLLTALSAALAVRRRRLAMLVLGQLSMAVQLRLPLPIYLRAAAAGESFALRRRLHRVAAALEDGVPVAVALQSGAGELPPLLFDRVAAAEHNASLGVILPALVKEQAASAEVAEGSRQFRAYAVLVAGVFLCTLLVFLLFVMPKYGEILRSFGIAWPAITLWMIDLVHPIFWLLQAAIVVPPLLLLVSLQRSGRGLFTSKPIARPKHGPGLWRRMIDRVQWHLPIFGRLVRSRMSAIACQSISDTLAAHRPLPAAIAQARMPHLNSVLSRRMFRWLERVQSGEPLAAAGHASGLPALWCAMLAGGRHDLAGAMAFAARGYAAQSHRLATTLRAVIPVVFTLVVAVLTLGLALAMFQPMIAVIDQLGVGRARP